MQWVYDDGGRSRYYKGSAGDCVTRAIAIATEQDYKQVYLELARMNKRRTGKRSARDGVSREDIKAYMAGLGWVWVPCMGIGTGCQVHMREDELPSGRIVCSLSRHIAAVVDGVLHDTYDSSRCGTRCVYGYWVKPKGRRGKDELASRVDGLVAAYQDGLISVDEFCRNIGRVYYKGRG